MNSKKEKKTIVGLIVSIIALLMFTIGMTFAYFTASNSTTSSSMTFGTLNINTNGLTAGQKSTTCGSPAHTLVPGCTIDLSAPVSVTGNIDALLRAQLTATVFQTNGVDSNTNEAVKCKIENNRVVVDETNGTFYALKSEATSVSNEQNLSFAEQVFILANTASYSGWTYSDDGFYYYNKVVNGASVNAASFATSFTLPANTMGNDWQGAYVQFGIELQAIQAEHLVNANNKKITFTKDNNNVITSISVESGATITVGENNKTLEDVFGVINGVAAWEAVEPEGNNNNQQGGGNDPAPTELDVQLIEITNMSFNDITPNGQGASLNDANEMNSLNNINASNSNLMSGNTKVVSVAKKDNTVSGALKIPDYVCKVADGNTWYTTEEYGELASAYDNGQALIDTVTYDVYMVTEIANSAFTYCYSITSITLPTNSNTLRVIGDGAFNALEISFGNLVIPEGVTSIGSSAFDTSNFTSVTIPASVTYIGQDAFTMVYNTLYFNAINCADLNGDECTMFRYVGDNNGLTIYIGENVTRIPANFINEYEYDTYSSISAVNVHSNNTALASIGAHAFAAHGTFTITVPTATVVDGSAFTSEYADMHVTVNRI